MECLMSGWLTKSPPEKKTQGPWKLFKAKWRKRYFVLNEVPAAQSIPGHRAALLYYDNENMKHKLGQIDLSSCDEVQQRLESSYYRHVFSLRTKHKGKDRTYYLVAESEPEMNKWVDCLCCVLGLKESDCEQKRNSVGMTVGSQNSTTATSVRPTSEPVAESSLPLAPAPRPSPSTTRVLENNNDADPKGEQYIHLDECWTGNKKQDLDLVPPPPARTRQCVNPAVVQDHMTQHQTYDKPRSYFPRDSSTRHDYYQSTYAEDQYDVPKSSRIGSARESAAVTTDDTYDIPRSLLHDAPNQDITSHPPGADERYINLPDSSKAYPQGMDSAYDFPSSRGDLGDHARDTALLNLTPPPPGSHMPKINKYVNAKAGVVPAPSVYGHESSSVVLPDRKVPSHSQTQEIQQAINDPQKLLLFCNHRTRSFKRNIASNQPVIPLPMKKDGVVSDDSSSEEEDDNESAFHPKAPELHRKYQPQMSRTLPPKKSLNSTPPPPPISNLEVQYLDLDLGADKLGPKAEQASCSAQGKDQASLPASTTDYREIDFVKTRALGQMKQDVEKKRLSSEQSTDES